MFWFFYIWVACASNPFTHHLVVLTNIADPRLLNKIQIIKGNFGVTMLDIRIKLQPVESWNS